MSSACGPESSVKEHLALRYILLALDAVGVPGEPKSPRLIVLTLGCVLGHRCPAVAQDIAQIPDILLSRGALAGNPIEGGGIPAVVRHLQRHLQACIPIHAQLARAEKDAAAMGQPQQRHLLGQAPAHCLGAVTM